MATTNLSLDTITTSQTVQDFMDAFNGNMGTIDALPLPVSVQENANGTAIKLANGTLIMAGKVSHGRTYKTTIDWEHNGGSGYASEIATVDFPVNTSGASPVIMWRAEDTNRCETWCIAAGSVTQEHFQFRYWSPASDNGGSKSVNYIAVGRWK